MTRPGRKLKPANSLTVAQLLDSLARDTSPGSRADDSNDDGVGLIPTYIADVAAALDRVAREAAESMPSGAEPIRITKSVLADMSRCEALAVAPSHPQEQTPAMVLGRLMDYAVAFALIRGRAEPALDVCTAMVIADGDTELVDAVGRLSMDDRMHADAMLASAMTAVTVATQNLSHDVWPIVQPPVEVVFAGGRVRLSGRFDVEFVRPTQHDGPRGAANAGSPVRPRRVAIAEIKSGTVTDAHRFDGYFYALLACLRDGVAPAWVVTWAPAAEAGIQERWSLIGGDAVAVHFVDQLNVARAGPLSPVPAAPSVIDSAARRVIDTIVRLAEIASGRPPARVGGFWCNHCSLRGTCLEARQVDGDGPEET